MTYKNNIMYHDIIESLAATIDAKDFYTAGHSTRVADTSYILGYFLGLRDFDLELLHMAAHLHDIGKIGVPDYVLKKKEKLLDNEWLLMKEHPQIGYNILSKADSLKYISKIILYHHEKFDGTGYPHNLKGNEIPFYSRIIAVCDSIDAMLSNRPYRNALSFDSCKEEIIKNINIMYDPEIVRCLIKNWDEVVVKYYNNHSSILNNH